MKNIIYGDTDSCYCTMRNYFNRRDEVPDNDRLVEVADTIGDKLNTVLPHNMSGLFLIDQERAKILEAGREVVATRGLFKDKKKRYALHVIDNEGKKTDKIKIMGMETRRSDTPKFIQEFLEIVLEMVVKDNRGYYEVKSYIDDWRTNVYYKMDWWDQGSPGRVKDLTGHSRNMERYWEDLEAGKETEKPLVPFQVKAAINTNKLIRMNNEHRWDYIRDGDKVMAFYLRPNPYNMEVVARKVDDTYIPDWFKELPVNIDQMEEKLLDKKLHNALGDIMGWDFRPPTNYSEEIFQDEDFY